MNICTKCSWYSIIIAMLYLWISSKNFGWGIYPDTVALVLQSVRGSNHKSWYWPQSTHLGPVISSCTWRLRCMLSRTIWWVLLLVWVKWQYCWSICAKRNGKVAISTYQATTYTCNPLTSLINEKGVGGSSPGCSHRGSKFMVDLSMRGGVPEV